MSLNVLKTQALSWYTALASGQSAVASWMTVPPAPSHSDSFGLETSQESMRATMRANLDSFGITVRAERANLEAYRLHAGTLFLEFGSQAGDGAEAAVKLKEMEIYVTAREAAQLSLEEDYQGWLEAEGIEAGEDVVSGE